MDPHDLALTALRAVLVYAALLVLIRILGRREIGNFSAFDLLVALMLGEVVDEVIYGDVSLAKGFTAILVIALLQVANSYAAYRSRRLGKLLSGEPLVVVENGKLQPRAMARERLSEDEVHALLRLHGVDEQDLPQVRRGVLESNGQLSVLFREEAKPLQKGDLDAPPDTPPRGRGAAATKRTGR